MQPASGVKCQLTLLPPWSWSLSALPWRPAWQAAAVLGRFRKPAYQTSGPLPSVHDFRVSNYLNFSNKWNKSHSGSPWLLECCTWWTTPRSRWTPPGFRRNCSVYVDRNSVVYLIRIFSFFIFLWLFLWGSPVRSLFRMALIRPPAGIENVLTEILFLRNKSLWKRWFPGTAIDRTKPNPYYIQALWDSHLLICHI